MAPTSPPGDQVQRETTPRSSMDGEREPFADTAVLVPCFNEAPTVAGVVRDFRASLPGAAIYVFDNNSTDRTGELAREAGAHVIRSFRQGKGNVVRHMFDVVDARHYIMADGDATYPAAEAPALIELLSSSGADMVVGTRLEEHGTASFRRFHRFGNRLLSGLISRIFRLKVTDVLSGYRVFSREFVRTIPLASQGFEVETELTLQAAAKGFVILEHPIKYGERPEGSFSKLNTFGDGWLILKLIFLILKDYKPLTFFGLVGLLLLLLSLAAGTPPVLDYVRFRWVYHVPLAVLAAALFIVSILSMAIGLLLHTVANYHRETFELWRKIGNRVGEAGDERRRPR